MNSPDRIQWKHQRLNNGCAWTCLAMLLSHWGIDIETEQLVAESIIPYLIDYNRSDESFSAGMQIQHTDVFNSITRQFELEHIDTRFPGWASYRKKAILLLGKGIPFMTSIANRSIPLSGYDKLRKSGGNPRGHAVVIYDFDDEGFCGLDPDGGLDRSQFYQFDSVKDKVRFKINSNTLRNGLAQKPDGSYLIGWQRPMESVQVMDMSDYIRRSKKAIPVFQNRMNAFHKDITSSAHISYETFMEWVHSMIKPFTIDLFTAIETIEQKLECQQKLADELQKLRKNIQEYQSNFGSDNSPNIPKITEKICILLTEHLESYHCSANETTPDRRYGRCQGIYY